MRGRLCFHLCLSVCLSVCASVCLSVCLSAILLKKPMNGSGRILRRDLVYEGGVWVLLGEPNHDLYPGSPLYPLP